MFNAGGYLSTIILIGSVLEGVLLHRMQENPKEVNKASKAPKDRNTMVVLTFDKWTLDVMIEVAYELKWIDAELKNFGHALRDYRNLIHPSRQLSTGIVPTQATCEVCFPACKNAVDKLLLFVE